MVRAVALVGFYRGDLVAPGQIIELPDGEFAELAGFCKVARAPDRVTPTEPAAPDLAAAKKPRPAQQ